MSCGSSGKFTDDQVSKFKKVKNMPAPGPLSAASGVRTSGDRVGRTPDSAGGQPTAAASALRPGMPRRGPAHTKSSLFTRYRMCITYRSGVNGVRRNYVLRARRRVNRRGARCPVALKMKKRKAFQPSLSLRAAGDVIVTSVQPNGNAIPPDVDPLRAVAARRTANHNSFDRCQ